MNVMPRDKSRDFFRYQNCYDLLFHFRSRAGAKPRPSSDVHDKRDLAAIFVDAIHGFFRLRQLLLWGNLSMTDQQRHADIRSVISA